LESRLLTGRHAFDHAVQSSRGIAPRPHDERGRRHDIGDLSILGGAHVGDSARSFSLAALRSSATPEPGTRPEPISGRSGVWVRMGIARAVTETWPRSLQTA